MKIPLKLLAYFWLPASIAMCCAGLAGLVNSLRPGFVTWAPELQQYIDQYRNMQEIVFRPLWNMTGQQAGIDAPVWAADITVLYMTLATAFLSASTTFTANKRFFEQTKSSAATLGFPIAMVMFVLNTLRQRVVSNFAKEHTSVFFGYLAAVAAAFGGVLYYNNMLVTGGAG